MANERDQALYRNLSFQLVVNHAGRWHREVVDAELRLWPMSRGGRTLHGSACTLLHGTGQNERYQDDIHLVRACRWGILAGTRARGESDAGTSTPVLLDDCRRGSGSGLRAPERDDPFPVPILRSWGPDLATPSDGATPRRSCTLARARPGSRGSGTAAAGTSGRTCPVRRAERLGCAGCSGRRSSGRARPPAAALARSSIAASTRRRAGVSAGPRSDPRRCRPTRAELSRGEPDIRSTAAPILWSRLGQLRGRAGTGWRRLGLAGRIYAEERLRRAPPGARRVVRVRGGPAMRCGLAEFGRGGARAHRRRLLPNWGPRLRELARKILALGPGRSARVSSSRRGRQNRFAYSRARSSLICVRMRVAPFLAPIRDPSPSAKHGPAALRSSREPLISRVEPEAVRTRLTSHTRMADEEATESRSRKNTAPASPRRRHARSRSPAR